MIISNAVIRLGGDPTSIYAGLNKGIITLNDKDKEIMFVECNISGGSIDSYHNPHFRQCLLRNVSKEPLTNNNKLPDDKYSPVFQSCILDNIKIPYKSDFTECAGNLEKNGHLASRMP